MAARSSTKQLERLAQDTHADASIDIITVELVPGVNISALPPRMWRLSAYRALRGGDIDAWAAECLATADDVALLIATNPTTEQFQAFAEELNRAAEAGGK